eukprot:2097577-Ditylum_brightwellii.AAC.1
MRKADAIDSIISSTKAIVQTCWSGDLWEKGDFAALVEDTVKTNKTQQPTGQKQETKEHVRQVYTRMLLQ